MLLVPRQLMRSGMTGNVPYYGGRMTPAQAYAASHPAPAPARRPPPPPPSPPPTRTAAPAATAGDVQAALWHLRETGVLTAEEYADLLTRTNP